MLSEREERELGLIEQALRADSRFAAAFGGVRRPLHRRPWAVRAAIVLGVVLFLAGMVLSAPGLFLQGFFLGATSYVWWCWKVKPTSGKPAAPAVRADRRWWGFPPVY